VRLVAIAAAATVALSAAPAQRTWVLDLLTDYAAGRHAEVSARLALVSSPRALEADLVKAAESWTGPPGLSTEVRRRTLAAFALEAAIHRAAAGSQTIQLIEWACRLVRRQPTPGAFERQWHLTAFAALGGTTNPDAIEAHVGHMRLQFPAEPRLGLERAIAADLRTAPFFDAGRASASDLSRRARDAALRFEDLLGSPDSAIRFEARVRLARLRVVIEDPQAALAALDATVPRDADVDLEYLAWLFRAWAFEKLNQQDQAADAYRRALVLRPRAQSATIGLALVAFHAGDRDEARSLAASIWAGTTDTADPWWEYWPGDFRHAPRLVSGLRQLVQ
jgi:tetratricopeptide (TPR) repeat protein